MTSNTTPAPKTSNRRRVLPIVWLASLTGALVMALGVNGTLASWTQALITNDKNSVSSVSSVALSESTGGTECVNTLSTTTNTAVCSTINKYSGTTLNPDGTNTATTTVVMKNTGTGSGNLTIKAGACSATGGASATTPLCDQMKVEVKCDGATKFTGTLTAFTTATTTTPQAIATLAAGASSSCDFIMTLPADTPAAYASQTASQPLEWKLVAA